MVTATELEIGAKIMSADGKELGTVKEVGADRFKVGRKLLPDYWLANEYVDHAGNGIVQMILTKEGLHAAKL
jgi:hypothetical protein